MPPVPCFTPSYDTGSWSAGRCVLLLFAALCLGSAELPLLAADDLRDATPAAGLAMAVTGGSFDLRGWTTTTAKDQVCLTLPEGTFGPKDAGAIEVDLLGFDPMRQYADDKHQFINLYSRPDGSKEDWEGTTKAWWNIRGGSNYMKDGGAGFKILATPSGLATRQEFRLIETTTDWNPSRLRTVRVAWDADRLSVHLDRREIYAGRIFGQRSECLRWCFLGTDNVYSGMVGVTYAGVRFYAATRPRPRK